MPRNPREAPRRAQSRPESFELHGVHPVLEALRARRRPLLRLRIRRGLRRPEAGEIREAALRASVPVEELEAAALEAAAPPGVVTQGVLLRAGPLPEPTLDEVAGLPGAPRRLVAFDGVEDPQNVGAVARVAEASGVQGLVLTRRHAPPLGGAVSRASAGAIEWLPAARVANLRQALKQLKDKGFWVFGCDAGEGDDVFRLPGRVVAGDQVVVLGAEGRGLRPGVREQVDHRVQVPMEGRVGSLNVAAAAAVVLYELRRRTLREPP